MLSDQNRIRLEINNRKELRNTNIQMQYLEIAQQLIKEHIDQKRFKRNLQIVEVNKIQNTTYQNSGIQ